MSDTGQHRDAVRSDASADRVNSEGSGSPRSGVGDPLATLAALASQCGGGFIPIPGRVIVDTKLLAHCMGVTDGVVSEWLNDYEVPVAQPGRKQFVDAEEFLKHLPRERDNAKSKTRKR